MSITTGGGDKGMTDLWSGGRIAKDSERVDAYGTIDELNSHIGEAKHCIDADEIVDLLLHIQRDLFKVAGQLASLEEQYVEPVTDDDAQRLTDYIHHYESIMQLKGFVIPGNTIGSAKLDVCRTIARRAERCIVKLLHTDNGNVPEALLRYVNRLSDFLFIAARYEEFLQNKIVYKNDITV